MRWQGGRQSDNVEDRRGMGGGRGRPMMVGGGLGTLAIVVIILLLGGDPRALLDNLPQQQPGPDPNAPPGAQAPVDPAQEELKQFVSVILADTEDVWTDLFAQIGKTYRKPKLVLFTGEVDSACGYASAAVGPFYCPGDEKVYIDLGFYDELQRKFKAPGDFAQAYVIAHEIGHHVQNQLGISDKVHAMQQRVSKSEANELSVRLELQADYFAGVWAHHAQRQRQLLESGDIEEGLRAAAAIGDDNLQMQGQGYVVPDSFTHGSSEQRVRWFRKGLQSGDMTQGDTFSATSL
jgi:predicted metalloprotease